MYVLYLIETTAWLIFGFLFLFLILSSQKKLIRLACSLIFLCYGLVFFGLSIVSDPANLGNVPAMFFSSFFLILSTLTNLFFLLVVSHKKITLKLKLFGLVFLIIPSILIYKQLIGGFIMDVVYTPFGVVWLFPQTIWTNLYFAYYLFCLLIGLYQVYAFLKKEGETFRRKQAQIVLYFGILLVLLESIFYLFFLKQSYIVILESIFLPIFWSSTLLYAVMKYEEKPLGLSQEELAENVIKILPDLFFLVDVNGNILKINEAVLSVLGYRLGDLFGQPIKNLFGVRDINFIEDLINVGEIENRQIFILNKNKNETPFFVSGSVIRNGFYIVIIAKDARDIKRYSEERLLSLTPILIKAAEGNFTEKIKIPDTKDEFTEHLVILSKMIDNFKGKIDELNEKSEILEEQHLKFEEISKQIKEEILEIEKYNRVAVERELEMIQLKKENDELKGSIEY